MVNKLFSCSLAGLIVDNLVWEGTGINDNNTGAARCADDVGIVVYFCSELILVWIILMSLTSTSNVV